MFGLQRLLKVGVICVAWSCCIAPTLPIAQNRFSAHVSHKQLLQPVLAADQQHFNPKPRGPSRSENAASAFINGSLTDAPATVPVTIGSTGDAAEQTRLLAQFVLSNSNDLRGLFHRCAHFRDFVCEQHQRSDENDTWVNEKSSNLALSSNTSAVLASLLNKFGLDNTKVLVMSASVQLLPPQLPMSAKGSARADETLLQHSLQKEEHEDVSDMELDLHSSDVTMSASIDADSESKVDAKSPVDADIDGEPLARQFLRLIDERADQRRSDRRRYLSSKNETNIFRQVYGFVRRKSRIFIEVEASPPPRDSHRSRPTLQARATVSAILVSATAQVADVVARLESLFRRSSRNGANVGTGGLHSQQPCFQFLECLAADFVLRNVSKLSP